MRALIAVVLGVTLAGCWNKEFPPPPVNRDLREPLADSTETVIYLVGDAGEATARSSPILQR
ncbi:MAG TPA: hypothetical protein VK864_03240, partial [Longimicrobiales bacterium]|nr:hypothetical protein [Longimicrobiales bacterium]